MNYERGVGRFASRIDEHAQPPAALRLGFSSRSKQVQQEPSGVRMTSPLSEGEGREVGTNRRCNGRAVPAQGWVPTHRVSIAVDDKILR